MRCSIQRSLAASAALFGAALLCSAGCDRSCHANATCWYLGVDTGERCPDDPAEREPGPQCGVWVSASIGDDGNDGTQEKPLKTLVQAIHLARERAQNGEGPARVYACGGVYAGPVEVAGVSISGGFACDEGRWEYVGKARWAEIQAPPDPAALVLPESEAVSFLTDVRIVAGDGTTPGGSSIAVLALEGSQAVFRRADLIAGNGADGADGADGSHDGQPALGGLPGKDGADACTADIGLGGVAVNTPCEIGTSTGGQGGDANDVAASDGFDGLQPPDMNPQGFGAGGQGEDAAQGTLCTGGQHGAHGADGQHGAGAVGPGRLTKDGYVGVAGGDGQPGLPGQGGGGGGASLGSALCAAGGLPTGGAAGGSGGSGGCGGKGGKGGQAGGSSFGLALLSSGISLEAVAILAGNGGNGGNGGTLQQGGQSGLPGAGGFGLGANGPRAGCGGGLGGKGGNGGNGGGGLGGHSAAVARLAWIRYDMDDATTRDNGHAGTGGTGVQSTWYDGKDGTFAIEIKLDP